MCAVDLAARLAQIEQKIAQEQGCALNPAAPLVGLDPQEIDEEVSHCRFDPIHFINEYCMVESDEGAGVVPFKLWPYQVEVLRQWLEYPECVTLKARQLGVTELAAALALWQVNFHPHNKVIVFSQDETKAKEFSRKVRLAWQHLPPWLQTPVSDPLRTSTVELVNGSRVLPQAATERAARSLNCQMLIIDEAAHQQHFQEIFEAAAVTARSAGNRVLVISTAAGAGTPFHRLWLQAEAGQGMHPLFLGWRVRPGRDEEWYRHATAGYEQWKASQEFPSNPQEAFILAGRGRFDTQALRELAQRTESPLREEHIAGGTLSVWEEPQQAGRYVAGADTAEGLLKGDYSACCVMDYYSGREVAVLHGKWEPAQFAAHLAALCRRYSDAFLGVERNGPGMAVLLALLTSHGYNNLYYHQEWDGEPTPRPGWQTTTRSKPIMIDALAMSILERRPFRNAAFIGECMTYVVDEKGGTGASGTTNDDLVMAYAVSEMLRRFEAPHTEVVSLHDELSAVMDDAEWERLAGSFGGHIDDRY